MQPDLGVERTRFPVRLRVTIAEGMVEDGDSYGWHRWHNFGEALWSRYRDDASVDLLDLYVRIDRPIRLLEIAVRRRQARRVEKVVRALLENHFRAEHGVTGQVTFEVLY